MSKIIINNTISPLVIGDVGVTISASSQYTIPPQDYLLWAASDDIITAIGSGDATVNDGSSNLSINNGSKLIQGIFPNPIGIEGSNGTQIGNVMDALKVSAKITDGVNHSAAVSTFSELQVAQRVIDLQAKFIYGVSSIFFNKQATNGGTLSQANSQAQLNTGTNSAGKYVLQTKKYVNYRVSETNEFSTSCRFASVTGSVGSQIGVNNSQTLIGIFIEGQDGIYVGFKNNGRFSAFYLNNGVETQIQASSFNVDKLDGTTITDGVVSRYAPDWTKIQLIRFTYSWHGTSAINYQIQDANEEWITFHRQRFINTLTIPSINTPLLPVTALVQNTGNTSNVEMDIQDAQVSFIGDSSVNSQAKGFAVDHTKSVSLETPIISIRNNTTFNSKSNGIRVSFQTIGLASDGNKSVIIRAYVDSILTGAVFTNVSTTESTVSVDTTALIAVGGLKVASIPLAKVDTYNDDISALDLELQPGQSVTFTGTSASSNEITIGIRWRELH